MKKNANLYSCLSSQWRILRQTKRHSYGFAVYSNTMDMEICYYLLWHMAC